MEERNLARLALDEEVPCINLTLLCMHCGA